MLRIVFSLVFLVTFGFPFLPGILSRQDKESDLKVFETFDRSCEFNRYLIDGVADLTLERDSRLFVISRLGTGDNRPRLGHRRLHNVRAKILPVQWRRFDPAKLITAEGERVKGPGRLEFYVGSKLVIVATFRRNADFCVDCCEWPDRKYYGRGKRN